MAEIKVRCKQGNYNVLVDDADYEWLNKHSWFDMEGYAYTSAGKGGSVGMHRMILGLTDPNLCADHVHGNRRDYRRSELQVLTRAANRKKKHVALVATEEPGIKWSEFKRRFCVGLWRDGRKQMLGEYTTMEKAVSVRDAEIRLGGFSVTYQGRFQEAAGASGEARVG